MMNFIIRNQASLLKKLLKHFSIVAIIGARQTGKTSLAKMVCPDWRYADLENPDDLERISEDPAQYFKQYPNHVILDEVQEFPEIFKRLRGIIDQSPKQKGRFVLTGSSSPELSNHLAETLAGRCATIELGTLTMNEFYKTPISHFYQLFKTKLDASKLISGRPPFTNEQVQHVWLKGGYPEPTLSDNDYFYQKWMQHYYQNYIQRDIARLFPRLNTNKYQQFIKMLCKLTGTILNKANFARALEISQTSIQEYLSIAEGTFLWRNVLSYETNVIKTTTKMPKGYIRDTGLLHFLTKIKTKDDLYFDPIVGYSFETFVIETLINTLLASDIHPFDAYYFRTQKGTEIDLILEGYFGVLPIEIKYSTFTSLKQCRSLEYFLEKHQLPFGMVINQSEEVSWLSKKIIQIPVGWL